MKKIIFAGVLGLSLNSNAYNGALLQNQLLKSAPSDILKFDGAGFGPDIETFKKEFKKNPQNTETAIDLNLKGGSLKLSNSTSKYLMTWENQQFENRLDLRIGQLEYSPVTKKFTTRSTTFNDNYLRSVTQCEGANSKSVYFDKEVYCATATPKICQKVLTIYNSKNKDTPAAKLQQQANSCIQTLQEYSKVIDTFADRYDDNASVSVSNAREKIIKQEDAEVKNLLSRLPEGSTLKRNDINSLKTADDFKAVSDKLTGSLQGLSIVNNFITLCQENIGKFDPAQLEGTLASKASARARPSTSSANGKR